MTKEEKGCQEDHVVPPPSACDQGPAAASWYNELQDEPLAVAIARMMIEPEAPPNQLLQNPNLPVGGIHRTELSTLGRSDDTSVMGISLSMDTR